MTVGRVLVCSLSVGVQPVFRRLPFSERRLLRALVFVATLDPVVLAVRIVSMFTGSSIRETWTGASRSVSIDRKSTRLNSSHVAISYAVFCFAAHLALPSFPTRRSSDLVCSLSVGVQPVFRRLPFSERRLLRALVFVATLDPVVLAVRIVSMFTGSSIRETWTGASRSVS